MAETEAAASKDASTTARSTIILHDSGDVTLLLGTGEAQQSVAVSSSVLRLASPVWNAMFASHWAESEAHEIPLPDDDPEAMLIVLRIAHLKSKDLSGTESLSTHTLHRLAVVCDKYDLVSLVTPCNTLYRWVGRFFCSNISKPFWPKGLFIAWTFKDTFWINKFADRMAYNVTVDADGIVKFEGKDDFEDDLPGNILETILEVRENTLTSMLKECYDTLDRLMNHHPHSTITDKEEQCRFMIVGSFSLQLAKLGIYPDKRKGSDIHFSVRDFQKKLDMIQDTFYSITDCDNVREVIKGRIPRDKAHLWCVEMANLSRAIGGVIRRSSRSSKISRVYMKVQAKK